MEEGFRGDQSVKNEKKGVETGESGHGALLVLEL